MNSLNHLTENGVVVLHDCNPPELWFAREDFMFEGEAHAWNGTVWKSIYKLRATRPDLFVCTVDTDYGIGIVKLGKQECCDFNNSFYDFFFFIKFFEIIFSFNTNLFNMFNSINLNYFFIFLNNFFSDFKNFLYFFYNFNSITFYKNDNTLNDLEVKNLENFSNSFQKPLVIDQSFFFNYNSFLIYFYTLFFFIIKSPFIIFDILKNIFNYGNFFSISFYYYDVLVT
jgi:hypothetical protein